MSQKPSVSMSDDLFDEINDRLGPGFSQFMREAARRSMYIEDRDAEFGGKLPDDWWQDAIDEYIETRTHPARGHGRDEEQEIEA